MIKECLLKVSTMSYKVLIPQDVNDKGKAYLREHGYEIIMGSGASPEIIAQEVTVCDAIFATE